MGFSLRKKLKNVWEVLTPQNEEGLRAGNRSIVGANIRILQNAQSGKPVYGPLARPGASQQFAQNNAPTRFSMAREAPKVMVQNLISNPLTKGRDVFDANSTLDRSKRLQAGQPELYADQQKAMGIRRAPNNLAQAIAGNAAANVNTLASRLIEAPEAVRGAVAGLTKNEDALNASVRRSNQWREDLYGNQKSGLLGAGTIYDNTEEAKNLGVAETAKRTAGGQLEASFLNSGWSRTRNARQARSETRVETRRKVSSK